MIPLGKHDAGRTDPAFEPFGVGPGAGADGALGELRRAGRSCRSLAERGVGSVVEPSAHAEVEQHGRRDDRYDVVGIGPDLEPAVAGGQPAHHAVGGSEAVGAAPGEAHGVDVVDEVDRVEQLGLASAGGAATEVDAADRSWRRQHDRRAGQPAAPASLVVADVDPGDVGEVVVRPDHCVPRPRRPLLAAPSLALARSHWLASAHCSRSSSRKRRAAST